MKRLTPTEKIALLAPAAAVLRAMQITDSTISYRDFARPIGMTTADDGWMPASRFWLGELLHLLGEVYGKDGLPYDRVINAKTGKPGDGLAWQLRKERAA